MRPVQYFFFLDRPGSFFFSFSELLKTIYFNFQLHEWTNHLSYRRSRSCKIHLISSKKKVVVSVIFRLFFSDLCGLRLRVIHHTRRLFKQHSSTIDWKARDCRMNYSRVPWSHEVDCEGETYFVYTFASGKFSSIQDPTFLLFILDSIRVVFGWFEITSSVRGAERVGRSVDWSIGRLVGLLISRFVN